MYFESVHENVENKIKIMMLRLRNRRVSAKEKLSNKPSPLMHANVFKEILKIDIEHEREILAAAKIE